MNESSERVNRVIDIDKNTANELVKSFIKDYTVEKIERFTEGKSTSNYKIKIGGLNSDLVLRIYPQNNGVCEKEYAIYNKVSENLPVPKVYYMDSGRKIIDKPYLIMEYLDGITLDKYIEKKGRFPEALAEEIGEKLAVLHRTEYEKEGFLDNNFNLTEGLPPILSWYDYFLGDIAGRRLKASTREKISRFIKNNNDLLLEMTQKFVLSHGDFRPENLMIKDDKLVGIMDWEFCFSAPCYFDIGQFIRIEGYMIGNVENSFIKGYNRYAKNHVTNQWKKLAKLMDLTNMLSFLNSSEERPNLFMNMERLIDKTMFFLMED